MRIKTVRDRGSDYADLDGKLLGQLIPFSTVSPLKTLLVSHATTVLHGLVHLLNLSQQHHSQRSRTAHQMKQIPQSCSFALSEVVAQLFFFFFL